jgi:signal recognition particle GTPase
VKHAPDHRRKPTGATTPVDGAAIAMTANSTSPSTGKETGAESQTHRQIAERARGEQLDRLEKDVHTNATKVAHQLMRPNSEEYKPKDLTKLHTTTTVLLNFIEEELTNLLDEEDQPPNICEEPMETE